MINEHTKHKHKIDTAFTAALYLNFRFFISFPFLYPSTHFSAIFSYTVLSSPDVGFLTDIITHIYAKMKEKQCFKEVGRHRRGGCVINGSPTTWGRMDLNDIMVARMMVFEDDGCDRDTTVGEVVGGGRLLSSRWRVRWWYDGGGGRMWWQDGGLIRMGLWWKYIDGREN